MENRDGSAPRGQGRPVFTDAAKDSGSKVTCRIEEHDCGQVCASGIGPKKRSL